MILIRCWGDHPLAGQWLKSADVEAFDGRGDATFTADQSKAMRFATIGDAFEYWRQTSKVRPVRDDGEPNRPLTHFSITFDTVPA